MIFVQAHCEIVGPEFSPSATADATTLRFRKAVEPGSRIERGRHKGKKAELGYAQLAVLAPELGPLRSAVGPDGESTDAGAILLAKLPGVVNSLRKHGAERITLFIDVSFVDQCNFELEPEVLKILSKAGVGVAISCFEADEDWGWIPSAKVAGSAGG